MMKPELSKFLRGLIHAGHETPPERFKEVALELLRDLIYFDMALWASGRGREGEIHNVYLYELPESLLASWENIKHQDRILANIVANPGKTVDAFDFYGRRERRELELYREHSKIFGIEAVISTALPDPETGLLEVMSLYRRSADPGFSRRDRLLKQEVFPFLNQTWHHNQIMQLKQACGHAPKGASAICDGHGWLRHAEGEFMELLRVEHPKWRPPNLPRPLRDWLADPLAEELRGEQVVFSKNAQHELILLQANPRGAMALLTPREEEIARSYAAGLTYREIAQDLELSASTVRRHLESVYRKLEVASKTELAQMVD